MWFYVFYKTQDCKPTDFAYVEKVRDINEAGAAETFIRDKTSYVHIVRVMTDTQYIKYLSERR